MYENNDNNSFNYSYSASRQDEIEKIKSKYMPPVEDKMEQLRKLDKSAEQKGTMIAIIVGTISMLIFGFGMACVTVWETLFVLGIIVGIIGFAGMGVAYVLYNVITAKERERIAPEIIRLADELSEGEITEDWGN